jgi:hypothetical protein
MLVPALLASLATRPRVLQCRDHCIDQDNGPDLRATNMAAHRAAIFWEESVLKSIDHLLNADVLWALRAMGHGDDVVLCDTNFPADSVARQTAIGRLLRIDGVNAPRRAPFSP